MYNGQLSCCENLVQCDLLICIKNGIEYESIEFRSVRVQYMYSADGCVVLCAVSACAATDFSGDR